MQKTLHRTGFEEVTDVRIGKYIELEVADGDAGGARSSEMCRKLLANTVIEDFRIEGNHDRQRKHPVRHGANCDDDAR